MGTHCFFSVELLGLVILEEKYLLTISIISGLDIFLRTVLMVLIRSGISLLTFVEVFSMTTSNRLSIYKIKYEKTHHILNILNICRQNLEFLINQCSPYSPFQSWLSPNSLLPSWRWRMIPWWPELGLECNHADPSSEELGWTRKWFLCQFHLPSQTSKQSCNIKQYHLVLC